MDLKKNYLKVLTFVSIIGVILIAVLSLVVCIVWATKAGPSDAANESVLLSAGIGMIGILIALKASFDISNIISRQDIENLNEKMDTCSVRIDELSKKSENLTPEITALNTKVTEQKNSVKGLEENTSTLRNEVEERKKEVEYLKKNILQTNTKNAQIQECLFYVEASRNNWDPILRYIISLFQEDNSPHEDLPFSDFTIIELKYTQVKNSHQSKYLYDSNLIAIAESGLLLIDAIMNGRSFPEFVESYLNYRKSGFNFYAGYCEENMRKGSERFHKAISGYKALHIPVDSNPLIEAHLNNSIGECYSKIIQYYNETPPLKSTISHTDLKVWSNEAIESLERAAACPELDDHTRSVFNRNLGAAYERIDDLTLMVGLPHVEKIIIAYTKSIEFAKTDDSPSSMTMRNAYFACLSYMKKCSNNLSDEQKGSYKQYADEAVKFFPWSNIFRDLAP